MRKAELARSYTAPRGLSAARTMPTLDTRVGAIFCLERSEWEGGSRTGVGAAAAAHLPPLGRHEPVRILLPLQSIAHSVARSSAHAAGAKCGGQHARTRSRTRSRTLQAHLDERREVPQFRLLTVDVSLRARIWSARVSRGVGFAASGIHC